MLALADDIDIIGLSKQEESRRLCLKVNEDKIKYMVSTIKQAERTGYHVSVDNYTFEVVNDFVQTIEFKDPHNAGPNVWRRTLDHVSCK